MRRGRRVLDRAEADRAIGFIVAAAAPFALAVQGGGYDIVARQFTSLAIWWLIAVALAFRALPRARPLPTMRLPAIGLVVLAAWTAASLLWTSSAEASFAELARLVGYAGVAALALTTLHRDNWRAAAAGLTTAAVAVSLLSVASRVAPGAFSGTSAAVVIDGRLSYPLGYWNAMGAWSVMALALSLGWSAHRAAPRARRVALALVPAIGLSIYLTYSRGALIGLAAAAVCLYLFAGDRRELAVNALIGLVATVAAILIATTQPAIANASGGQGGGLVAAALVALGAMSVAFADALARRRIGLVPWRRGTLAAVLAGVVVLVAGAGTLAPRTLPHRLAATPGTAQAPGTTDPAQRLASLHGPRPEIWRQAVDAFASRPLLGIGPGTFEFWWDRHVGRPPLHNAHSLYLQALAELGVLGLVALATTMIGLLVAAVHAARTVAGDTSLIAGLIAAALAFAVQAAGDWLWQIPATVALATVAILTVIASSAPAQRAPGRRRSWAFAGLALLAGALLVPGIVSTQLARDSSALLAAGKGAEAADSARAAVTAEPWSASAHAQLASAQQRTGRLAAARASARRAIDLEPDNWVHRLLLGTIDYQAGARGAALARFRQAATLDSKSPSSVTAASLRRTAREAREGGPAP